MMQLLIRTDDMQQMFSLVTSFIYVFLILVHPLAFSLILHATL